MLRLEAKIDALSKENALLRDRVKKIETVRSTPPAPVRIAALGNSMSDATPSSTGGVGSAARAASYPVKAMAPARAGCAQFGGAYVGGHGGTATSLWTVNDRNSWAKSETDLALPDDVSGAKYGWHAGGQAGWNWQNRCTVFGVEADWSWTGLKQTKTNTDGQAGAALDVLTTETDVRWFGTVRGRTGVVVDNLLLFAAGGLAYANVRQSSQVVDQGVAVPVETFASTKTRFGWTAGLGAEYAWTDNWSIKSEVLYVQFLDDSTTYQSAKAVSNGNPAAKTFDHQNALWASRVSLVYRWMAK